MKKKQTQRLESTLAAFKNGDFCVLQIADPDYRRLIKKMRQVIRLAQQVVAECEKQHHRADLIDDIVQEEFSELVGAIRTSLKHSALTVAACRAIRAYQVAQESIKNPK